MLKQFAMIASLILCGVVGVTLDGAAQTPHAEYHREPAQTSEFQQIHQPLWAKGAVTAGGLGLIGLELWWFLFNKPSRR